jgi:hypothetical protein
LDYYSLSTSIKAKSDAMSTLVAMLIQSLPFLPIDRLAGLSDDPF